MLAFFFLPTRMHERYLYCGLFFLLGSMILQRKLIKPFVLLSITFMLNLFYELPGHKTELKFADALYFINNLLDGKLARTPRVGLAVVGHSPASIERTAHGGDANAAQQGLEAAERGDGVDVIHRLERPGAGGNRLAPGELLARLGSLRGFRPDVASVYLEFPAEAAPEEHACVAAARAIAQALEGLW